MNKKRLMNIQRAIGISFLLISVWVIIMAQGGTTPIDTDITPVLFFVPFGLWLTLTKKLVIEL